VDFLGKLKRLRNKIVKSGHKLVAGSWAFNAVLMERHD